MNVIPFNVPGLPEPDALAGDFVIRPISVDPTGAQAGPSVALHDAAAPPAGSPTDGVLCIYPGTDIISYLFGIQVRSGQKDLLPGILVNSASVAGSCTLFSFSQDLNGNPVLIVTILPEEYLPQILTAYEGGTIADVSNIDDRLEFTQIFTSNSFGAVKRISNDLTHAPKEGGNAIFDLQKDLDVIADVSSFYMTRGLVLSSATAAAQGEVTATEDPIWQLLWQPATAIGILGFAVVYILTKTSVSYRNLNGNFGIDYNLAANRPPNPGQGQGQGQGQNQN